MDEPRMRRRWTRRRRWARVGAGAVALGSSFTESALSNDQPVFSQTQPQTTSKIDEQVRDFLASGKTSFGGHGLFTGVAEKVGSQTDKFESQMEMSEALVRDIRQLFKDVECKAQDSAQEPDCAAARPEAEPDQRRS